MLSRREKLPSSAPPGGSATSVAEGQEDGYGSLTIAIAAASLASAWVMAIEIVAGRMMARNYGATLPCWTTVIGVVLGGLSLGNYLGGRLADRFPIRRTISRLFLMASVCCMALIRLQHENLHADWILGLNWRIRILSHAMLLFFPASAILGMVGPLAGKLALSSDGEMGRTVGSLYACSTLGSILGTFLTGFYLIGTIGVDGVIWGVCITSAVGSIMIDPNRRLPVGWTCVACALGFVSLGPWNWTQDAGALMNLRYPPDEKVHFLQDSSYSRVAVVELADQPGSRFMYLDALLHSQIFIGEPDNLLYDYEKIYAVITHRFSGGTDRLTTLTLGGGGYVFPNFLKRHWPDSHVEVVEIDPIVTEAAHQAFGLPRDGSIEIHHLDARNHVEDLYRKKLSGGQVKAYDFIYCDVFNDISLPYHLTTVEFIEKVRGLLAPNGLYCVNIIDNYVEGNFLGAMIQTIDRVFPFVYAISPDEDVERERMVNQTTVVILGSTQPLNLSDLKLPPQVSEKGIMCWSLPEATVDRFRSHGGMAVLSDNYAPVDRLLSHLHAKKHTGHFFRHYNHGVALTEAGDREGAIEEYLKALKNNPSHVPSMNNLGALRATMNEIPSALNVFSQALAIEPRNYRVLANNGIALMTIGKYQEAINHLQRSIANKPDYAEAYFNLGHALLSVKDYVGASKAWREGLETSPTDVGLTGNLSRLLATCPDESLRNGEEAVALARKVLALLEQPDARALDTLGAALAEVGDFDQAIRVTEQALQLSAGTRAGGARSPENLAAENRLTDRMIEHIGSYKQKKPIRLD
jgi:tetratricopeptide (TPR) repeat protein/spermidine synthase